MTIGSHERIHQQYLKAKQEGKHGHLHKRLGANTDEPLWSWAVDDTASTSLSTSAPPLMMASSGERNEGDTSFVPPGYENHFIHKPIKGVESQQRHTNRLCGIIARDARPISFANRDGFVDYLKDLNPELKPPHVKTTMETLKAMKLKRQQQIGEGLRKTRAAGVKRGVYLPATLNLSYLPEEVRTTHHQMLVPLQYNAWSSDGWKRNNSAAHFLAVCTHSISHEFELSNKLVMFREFNHRSLSTNIANAFDTCFAELGVESFNQLMHKEGTEKEGRQGGKRRR